MRLTTKDAVATLLIAAIVVPYIGYLIWGEMPFLKDPRGMGATALVLGLLAALLAGRAAFDHGVVHRTALATGVVAFALGIATVWVGTSEVLLACFIGAIVITWALGEYAAHNEHVAGKRALAHSI
jgi:hypothetical protein